MRALAESSFRVNWGNRNMKICVISTTILPCPPKGYSGLEQLAYQQAAGLAAKGHKVLLVAPNGSVPPSGVELHQTTLHESEKQAYSGYWNKLPAFDAVIDNSWEKWSYILKKEGRLAQPILGVCHAPADTMYRVPPPVPKPCFVAISKDQAAEALRCWNIEAKVVYNGIDTKLYVPSSILGRSNKSRWLFLARMSSIKGPHIAVAIAQKMGLELDLVGDDKITGEPQLTEQIKQACDGTKLIYHGGVDRAETVGFFGRSKCLLHMNKHFREPFGLAPVEAMSCGLPVIAWDNGAMRETIKHGESGFLVKSEQEVEDIIREGLIDKLDPVKIRAWASQFSVENMINRYEELAVEAIATGGW